MILYCLLYVLFCLVCLVPMLCAQGDDTGMVDAADLVGFGMVSFTPFANLAFAIAATVHLLDRCDWIRDFFPSIRHGLEQTIIWKRK